MAAIAGWSARTAWRHFSKACDDNCSASVYLPWAAVSDAQVAEYGGDGAGILLGLFLPDSKRPPIERLRLGQLPLGAVRFGEIVQFDGDIRVVRAERVFVNSDCLVVKGFRFRYRPRLS